MSDLIMVPVSTQPQWQLPIGNESVSKIIINDTINFFSKTAISILLISKRKSFRVLFDKIASVYFIRKMHRKWPAQGTGTVPQ